MGKDVELARHSGDQDSAWPADLVRLYDARRTEYVRLAYLLTGHRLVAEEIVQESFIATRGRWGSVESPPAYVRAAVVNRSKSWLRRRTLEERHQQPDDREIELGADELWDALRVLTERQRAVVVLRYYSDLGYDTIAEQLGCRPATVRTSLHRALRRLRREIER